MEGWGEEEGGGRGDGKSNKQTNCKKKKKRKGNIFERNKTGLVTTMCPAFKTGESPITAISQRQQQQQQQQQQNGEKRNGKSTFSQIPFSPLHLTITREWKMMEPVNCTFQSIRFVPIEMCFSPLPCPSFGRCKIRRWPSDIWAREGGGGGGGGGGGDEAGDCCWRSSDRDDLVVLSCDVTGGMALLQPRSL